MDRILVVRHAQADGDDDADPTLSDLGSRQAAALGSRLAGEDVRRVLHSPKRRAHQTAELIAQRAGCPVIPSEPLDDRTPFPSADRWSDYPLHRWDWLRDVPELERDEDGEALSAAWDQISEPGPASTELGGTLVLVTHAFVVGWFVGRVLASPPASWMLMSVANASITEFVRKSTGEYALNGFNDVGHLANL